MMKVIKKNLKTILLFILLSFLVSLIISHLIKKDAYDKGLKYLETKNDYSISEMLEINKNTPEEDKLPKNLNNTFIYVYQYGCKDCYKNEKEIKKILDEWDINLYNIPYQSKQLDNIKQKVEIDQVPYLIYIDGSNKASGKTLIKEYASEITINKDALYELINLYRLENNIKE